MAECGIAPLQLVQYGYDITYHDYCFTTPWPAEEACAVRNRGTPSGIVHL
jgi:hypothetical protein